MLQRNINGMAISRIEANSCNQSEAISNALSRRIAPVESVHDMSLASRGCEDRSLSLGTPTGLRISADTTGFSQLPVPPVPEKGDTHE
jgi:hypothetical protein